MNMISKWLTIRWKQKYLGARYERNEAFEKLVHVLLLDAVLRGGSRIVFGEPSDPHPQLDRSRLSPPEPDPEFEALVKKAESFIATSKNLKTTIDENDIAAATWSYEHKSPAGFGTDTLPNAKARFVPLVTSAGIVGVLALWKKEAETLRRVALPHGSNMDEDWRTVAPVGINPPETPPCRHLPDRRNV